LISALDAFLNGESHDFEGLEEGEKLTGKTADRAR